MNVKLIFQKTKMMKNLNFFLLLLLPFNFIAQKDSITFRHRKMVVSYNTVERTYTISNPKRGDFYTKLKFVKKINNYFQVLDSFNNIFYYHEKDGRINDQVVDYYCYDEVEEVYDLSVAVKDDEYHVVEQEVGMQLMLSESREIINWFPKNNADSLVFINGQKKFRFRQSYSLNHLAKVDPRTIILCKDGQFIFPNRKTYDWISIFTKRMNYDNIQTRKNDLYGFYGIFEPRYSKLSDFNYYLAKFVKPNGDSGYVDMEGNEY